jgi:hypothetical protein
MGIALQHTLGYQLSAGRARLRRFLAAPLLHRWHYALMRVLAEVARHWGGILDEKIPGNPVLGIRFLIPGTLAG